MTTAWLTVTIIALILSALFSGCEMAYVTSDRVRVELDVSKGGIIGRILRRFYGNAELFISTILVGNNVVLVIYGMGAAMLLEPAIIRYISSNQAVVLLVQTLISTLVILLTGEFPPKTIFRINPNNSLRFFALPLYIFYIILYPLSIFTVWLSKTLMKAFGVKDGGKHLNFISLGDLNDYLEETIDDLEEHKQTVHDAA